MGQHNKLLMPLQKKAMVTYAVEAALGSKAYKVVVVTGHEAPRLRHALRHELPHTLPYSAITFAHNSNYASGLASSLKVGLNALPDDCSAMVVCLGDMPFISFSLLNALMQACTVHQDKSIFVATVKNRPVPPILWRKVWFDTLGKLQGDSGARHIIKNHPKDVYHAAVLDTKAAQDIDTPEKLTSLTSR